MNWIKTILTDRRFYLWTGGIIVAGALLLLVMDKWVMPAYTNYNEGVTIPDVTKVSLEEAAATLEGYGLRYEVIDRRANSIYPADYIIDQTPAARQIVKPNRKVYLTVNTAVKPTAVVPDLIGLSLRNAVIQLENYGLTSTGSPTYEIGEFDGNIMRQSIPAGDTVAAGTEVHLTVSVIGSERMVAVPDVTGLTLSEAQVHIQNAGLSVGEIRYQAINNQSPGTIVSVSPQGELREGESVALIVAEREDVQEEEEAGAVIPDTPINPPTQTESEE